MASFDEFSGNGFQMEPVGADGFVVGSGAGVVDSVVYDGAFALTLHISGEPMFDEVRIDLVEGYTGIDIRLVEYWSAGHLVFEVSFTADKPQFDAGNPGAILTMAMGLGHDHFSGSSHQDRVYGGPGEDNLVGHGGNDVLYGDSGRDEVDGGYGVDRVYGGGGNDNLYGGGEDYAKDKLWGGDGSDTFFYGQACGKDVIRDFSCREDRIMFDLAVVKNRKKLLKLAEQYKKGVAIEFSEVDVLKIEDVKLKQFKKADIGFDFL